MMLLELDITSIVPMQFSKKFGRSRQLPSILLRAKSKQLMKKKRLSHLDDMQTSLLIYLSTSKAVE